MARINVTGSAHAAVETENDILGALAEFSALVQEAVLTDKRKYRLNLSFSAYEEDGTDQIGDVF
jgi:hypothetical protein